MSNSPANPALRAVLMETVASLQGERSDYLRDIEGWRARIREAEHQIAGVEEKIIAARLLMGEGSRKAAELEDPWTWPAFILRTLSAAERGLTAQELMRAGDGTPIESKRKSNPNAFYTSLGRLEARERVVRQGKRIYVPEVWARVLAGEIVEPPDFEPIPASTEKPAREVRPPKPPKPPPAPREDGLPAMILRVLEGHPEGLSPVAVANLLKETPGGAKRVGRDNNVLQATLSKMYRYDRLARHERRYRLLKYPAPTAPAEREVERAPVAAFSFFNLHRGAV